MFYFCIAFALSYGCVFRFVYRVLPEKERLYLHCALCGFCGFNIDIPFGGCSKAGGAMCMKNTMHGGDDYR